MPSARVPGWLRRRAAGSTATLVPTAVALIGAVVIGVSGVRGADYPAHFLRAELWREVGVSVWNFRWYGGHPTTTYSVIVPPIAAVVGVFAVGAAASVAGTWLFSTIAASYSTGPWARAGTIVFALASTVNVLVGRVPFAVGLAIALAAADQWRRGRLVSATVAAALVPLASPVASTFLAIAATAWLIDAWLAKRWRHPDAIAGWVVGASAVALVVVSFAFRTEGRFPFRADQVAFSIALMGVLAVATRERVVRIGAALAALASIVAFAVPNPLGGNLLRFTQFLVVPAIGVVAGVSARRRPWVLAAIFAVGTVWSMQVGAVAAVAWSGDASVAATYHEPLVDEVRRRNGDGRPLGRLEIPFTENHWEAYFVAAEVPFARGWERQIDLERNAVLYDESLGVGAYTAWLEGNAVRWVAVPDTDLDEGGSPEARLIASGSLDAWLAERWRNDNWVLYEVLDYQPIVDAPARLVAERVDAIVVSTPEPATVVARYEVVDGVSIAPDGCVLDADGAMLLELPEAGTYTITVDPSAVLPGDGESSCPRE
jgi:hypothetical protein